MGWRPRSCKTEWGRCKPADLGRPGARLPAVGVARGGPASPLCGAGSVSGIIRPVCGHPYVLRGMGRAPKKLRQSLFPTEDSGKNPGRMQKVYVSREGLEKMKADLAELNERRLHVADQIEHARGLGDLRENAEYHAAKEAQAMVHALIRDLEDKITRAVLLEGQDIDPNKAYLGALVRVLNRKTKREITYALVSPVEMDLAQNKISVQSPVGRALLGRSVGEVVKATVPAGELELEILEISR